jgi:hypothetical protein
MYLPTSTLNNYKKLLKTFFLTHKLGMVSN